MTVAPVARWMLLVIVSACGSRTTSEPALGSSSPTSASFDASADAVADVSSSRPLPYANDIGCRWEGSTCVGNACAPRDVEYVRAASACVVLLRGAYCAAGGMYQGWSYWVDDRTGDAVYLETGGLPAGLRCDPTAGSMNDSFPACPE